MKNSFAWNAEKWLLKYGINHATCSRLRDTLCCLNLKIPASISTAGWKNNNENWTGLMSLPGVTRALAPLWPSAPLWGTFLDIAKHDGYWITRTRDLGHTVIGLVECLFRLEEIHQRTELQKFCLLIWIAKCDRFYISVWEQWIAMQYIYVPVTDSTLPSPDFLTCTAWLGALTPWPPLGPGWA